jgi:hypothetical protein
LRQLGMVALRLNMVGAEAVAPDGSECGRGLARARVAFLCYMGSEPVGQVIAIGWPVWLTRWGGDPASFGTTFFVYGWSSSLA